MHPLPSTHHVQLVRKIAAVAHYGGLLGLTEDAALHVIRELSKDFMPKGSVADLTEAVHKALLKQ